MKYIDADKLIAEIERRRLSNRYIDTESYENELLEIITSLQQEQPEVDLEKELIFYHNEHFSPCENDVLFSERTGRELDYSDYEDIAHHFAEWGAIHLNARKDR